MAAEKSMYEYVLYTEQKDKHTKQDEHYVSARVCFRIRGAFLLLLFAVSLSPARSVFGWWNCACCCWKRFVRDIMISYFFNSLYFIFISVVYSPRCAHCTDEAWTVYTFFVSFHFAVVFFHLVCMCRSFFFPVLRCVHLCLFAAGIVHTL